MNNLNKKNINKKYKGVFILGAASDIALKFIPLIAKQTENFYLSARNIQQLINIKTEIEQISDAKVHLIAMDLDLDHEKSSLETFKKYLDFEIDLYLCFSGYLGLRRNQFLIDRNEMSQIININFTQVVLYTNAIAQKFYKQGFGSIVVVSSVAGFRGRQSLLIYSSAKAALNTYLEGLRCILFKKKIHVLNVLPGPVKTKMLGNNKYWPFVTCTSEVCAKQINRALIKKKKVVYVTEIWRYLVFIIKILPERLFYYVKI